MFGIRTLKKEVADLKNANGILANQIRFELEDNIQEIIKDEFNRISDSFDKLIVSESDRLRKDYAQFKKAVNTKMKEK